MGVFGLVGKGVMAIVALIGVVIWLGLTYQLTKQSFGDFPSDLLAAGPRKLAILVGVPLLLIGSVLFLRISGKLSDFFLAVTFAALLCAYGIGVPMLSGQLSGSQTAQNTSASDFTPAANEEDDTPAATTDTTVRADTAAPPPPITAPATDTGPDDTTSGALSGRSGRGPAVAPGGSPSPAVIDRPSMAPGTTTTRGRTIDGDDEQQTANTQLTSSEFTMEDLRFNKPESMRINQPYVIEAQIGVPTTPTIATNGPRVTRSVPIPGSRMVRVELVANDFDIQKLHQVDNQLLTPGATASWMWRVTPRSQSEQAQLLLQVFGVLRQQGYEGTVLIKTYQEAIPIEVTPIDRFTLGAQSFLARWDIIAGLAGAIGGIWVFFMNIMKALRGRREQPA